MKRIQQLTQDIIELTFLIEQNYPELYQYLDEIPDTIPSSEHPSMDAKNLSNYLNSLKELLKHHLETHVE